MFVDGDSDDNGDVLRASNFLAKPSVTGRAVDDDGARDVMLALAASIADVDCRLRHSVARNAAVEVIIGCEGDVLDADADMFDEDGALVVLPLLLVLLLALLLALLLLVWLLPLFAALLILLLVRLRWDNNVCGLIEAAALLAGEEEEGDAAAAADDDDEGQYTAVDCGNKGAVNADAFNPGTCVALKRAVPKPGP
jgi:hypothetical protein